MEKYHHLHPERLHSLSKCQRLATDPAFNSIAAVGKAGIQYHGDTPCQAELHRHTAKSENRPSAANHEKILRWTLGCLKNDPKVQVLLQFLIGSNNKAFTLQVRSCQRDLE